ncbi:hypothetical protein [Ferrovibrio sp.]|uniref:hypothetical protein n=1 Tax=Ferrovibrio sp. TaxID=1917215 RepID=UPI0025BBF45A|nr:hypothetical protein [Ferrovibrio sp.]
MATPKTFNGVVYQIPTTGETGWGDEVADFLVSVADNAATLNSAQTLQNKTLALPIIRGLGNNDALTLVKGTTGQRPLTPAAGDIRWNTTTGSMEINDGSQWLQMTGPSGFVQSISGTANEVTVSGTTTATVSLPSALTFTGKTVTGGTFDTPTINTPAISGATLSGSTLANSLTAYGVPTDVAFTLSSKGNAAIALAANSATQVSVLGPSLAVNYLSIGGSVTGQPIIITAQGIDAVIGITFAPVDNGDVIIDSTGALVLPRGTTAERPGTSADGYIRYNDELETVEAHISGGWKSWAVVDELLNNQSVILKAMGF